jgi:hypothetical protein
MEITVFILLLNSFTVKMFCKVKIIFNILHCFNDLQDLQDLHDLHDLHDNHAIIPAATVSFVPSSIKIIEPVILFFL